MKNRSSYEFLNCGHCLGSLIPDGSFLAVDANAEIEVGDIVTVVIKPVAPFVDHDAWASGKGWLGVTKIFLGIEEGRNGEQLYLFGQINPPLIAPVPKSALAAVHLVTGGVTPTGLDSVMTDSDQAGMNLLAPFFRACGTQQPVNPDWRPPKENEAMTRLLALANAEGY